MSLPIDGLDERGYRPAAQSSRGLFMSGRRQALVIGGSVGGLFAALLLRQSGWDATVFERSRDDLAGRGAGIGVSAELITLMRRVGARLSGSSGVDLDSYVWFDAQGYIVEELPRPMVSSAWSRVYRPLRDALPAQCYRPGMTLASVEQDAAGVTAIFADGALVRGDLLIGADGIHSTVRRQFLPEVEPRYAGYVAWRGMVEERDLSPAHRDAARPRIAFAFPEGEMLLSMPVPGENEDARAGHRRIYFIWYRPADYDTTLRDLCTDAAGRCHGISIPPPLIRREHIDALKTRARESLAPHIAEIVVATTQPLLQSIFDLEAPCLTFGRVALLGDAGFVARPHVAAGVTKAALNAACLVDSLTGAADDLATGLARYDRLQQEFGAKLVAHARHLGAYLEGQSKPVAQRRDAELRRDPLRIMREYGAPHLVHDADTRYLTSADEAIPAHDGA
jgi:2-polyprenyl-6-methoxyphenol hydroxylase-like FAD-dependent oxidoreductase